MLNDFISEIKGGKSFENLEDSYSFLREILPKITFIEDEEIKVK